jgi:hypothetical protein
LRHGPASRRTHPRIYLGLERSNHADRATSLWHLLLVCTPTRRTVVCARVGRNPLDQIAEAHQAVRHLPGSLAVALCLWVCDVWHPSLTPKPLLERPPATPIYGAPQDIQRRVSQMRVNSQVGAEPIDSDSTQTESNPTQIKSWG